jgi:hypothetical protein
MMGRARNKPQSSNQQPSNATDETVWGTLFKATTRRFGGTAGYCADMQGQRRPFLILIPATLVRAI